MSDRRRMRKIVFRLAMLALVIVVIGFVMLIDGFSTLQCLVVGPIRSIRLAQARAMWEQRPSDSYIMIVTPYGHVPLYEYRVTVEDGLIVDAASRITTRLLGDRAADEPFIPWSLDAEERPPFGMFTMDDMFDMAAGQPCTSEVDLGRGIVTWFCDGCAGRMSVVGFDVFHFEFLPE